MLDDSNQRRSRQTHNDLAICSLTVSLTIFTTTLERRAEKQTRPARTLRQTTSILLGWPGLGERPELPRTPAEHIGQHSDGPVNSGGYWPLQQPGLALVHPFTSKNVCRPDRHH